jgi:hypothetical protein
VHPAHVSVGVLQKGVVPVQADPLVAVHSTQWFVVELHAGVGPLQLPSA